MEDPLNTYLGDLKRRHDRRFAALYLVGSPALGDFSERHSNLDLVAVSDPPLSPTERSALGRSERRLARAGRPAVVWHTGWEVIADGPGPGPPESPLETPLTRALLRDDAIALAGPDWPVVAYESTDLRAWCTSRLSALASTPHGAMVMRKGVSSLVLHAAQLAAGATIGKVLSKSEAATAAAPLVPTHFRRILTDSAGYRRGARTSMYWGPFERKYDARQVIAELARAVTR